MCLNREVKRETEKDLDVFDGSFFGSEREKERLVQEK